MRTWLSFTLMAIWSALSVPGAAQPIAATPSPDRASWLAGTWVCRSNHAGSAVETYTANADGWFSLVTRFTTASGRTGEYDDTFRFDPATGRWSWRSVIPGPAGIVEEGSAAPWTGNQWTFEGTEFAQAIRPDRDEEVRRKQREIRVIFVPLSDTSYQREFDVEPTIVNGKHRVEATDQWVAESVSVCDRPSPAAPSPAASP